VTRITVETWDECDVCKRLNEFRWGAREVLGNWRLGDIGAGWDTRPHPSQCANGGDSAHPAGSRDRC